MLHMRLTESEKKTLLVNLRAAVKESSIRQEDIAQKLEIDQARVSRLLSGNFARWGGDIERLCVLFGISPEKMPAIDASQNSILLNALNRNWDGSAEHAQILARIIDNVCEATRYSNSGN